MSDPPQKRAADRAKSFQRHYFPEIFSELDPKAEEDSAIQTSLKGFRRTTLAPSLSAAHSQPAAMPADGAALEPRNPTETAAAGGDQFFAQGYEEGRQAGIAAERGRLESIIKMLRLAMEEIEGLKADLLRAAERQALHLALAVARKVLQTEVQTNPEAVTHVVRSALEHVKEAQNLTIRVNPADLHILKNMQPRSPELNGILEKCNLESDGQLSPGGCLIQSDLGEIDARIATQLEFIEDRFMTLLKETD